MTPGTGRGCLAAVPGLVNFHSSASSAAAANYKLDDPQLPLPRFMPKQEKHRPLPSPLLDAIRYVKGTKRAKFDETVDLRLILGTDPRRGDQAVRGTAMLPYGTGRTVRVAAFVEPEDAAAAMAAGADLIGNQALVDRIAQEGSSAINFEKLVATKSFQPMLSKVARILGPKGLMPNAKLGTLTDNVADAVKTLKAGRIDFRADRSAVLHAGVGKASFTDKQLEANVLALVRAVLAVRPKGVKGGAATGYIKRAGVSATMGLGFPVNTANLIARAAVQDG